VIIYNMSIADARALVARVVDLCYDGYDESRHLNRFGLTELAASLRSQLDALPSAQSRLDLVVDDHRAGDLIGYLAPARVVRATKNTTPQDAFERVVQAQLGSLVEPTEAYLTALRQQLYLWIEAIGVAFVSIANKDQPEDEDKE
jgi:hypothetical protein